MANPKITVVGAGNVGATCAHLILLRDIADVVLIDAFESIAKGKSLDMMESKPIFGFSKKIVGNTYQESAGSDIVIITAGLARKSGMSREELASKNLDIVSQVSEQAIKYSPDAIFLLVTNPLDLMCLVCKQVTGLPREKVIGQAGVLDGARMAHFLSEMTCAETDEINAVVLGSHGDTMVPVLSQSTVKGKKVSELLSDAEIEEVVKKTKFAGAEIVEYLKTGSAFYSPASATVKMAEAIIKDTSEQMCCSVYLEGEYGSSGMYIGVPVVLDKTGIKEIIEIPLTEQEQEQFKASFNALDLKRISLAL